MKEWNQHAGEMGRFALFCAAAAWEDEDTIRGDMTAMCIPRSTSLGDLWPILERLIGIFEKP